MRVLFKNNKMRIGLISMILGVAILATSLSFAAWGGLPGDYTPGGAFGTLQFDYDFGSSLANEAFYPGASDAYKVGWIEAAYRRETTDYDGDGIVDDGITDASGKVIGPFDDAMDYVSDIPALLRLGIKVKVTINRDNRGRLLRKLANGLWPDIAGNPIATEASLVSFTSKAGDFIATGTSVYATDVRGNAPDDPFDPRVMINPPGVEVKIMEGEIGSAGVPLPICDPVTGDILALPPGNWISSDFDNMYFWYRGPDGYYYIACFNGIISGFGNGVQYPLHFCWEYNISLGLGNEFQAASVAVASVADVAQIVGDGIDAENSKKWGIDVEAMIAAGEIGYPNAYYNTTNSDTTIFGPFSVSDNYAKAVDYFSANADNAFYAYALEVLLASKP